MENVMFVTAYPLHYLRTRRTLQEAYRFIGIYDLEKRVTIIPVRCSKCGKASVMVMRDGSVPVYGECMDCGAFQKLYYSYTPSLNKNWEQALANNNFLLRGD